MRIQEGKPINLDRPENAPHKDVLRYLIKLGCDLIPCINYSLGITLSNGCWIQVYTPATSDGWDIGVQVGKRGPLKFYYGLKSLKEVESLIENIKALPA
jgi:hypothetical protein